jgi:FkbM family methyltransferase
MIAGEFLRISKVIRRIECKIHMTSMGFTNRFLRWVGHQSWLPWSFRVRFVRYFRHPDRTPPTPFEVDFFGQRYSGSLNVLVDQTVFFFGAYALQELYLLRDLLKLRGPQPTFVDIGANVGHHSLFLSRYASQVHSFEPWSVVSRHISEKISLNSITNISLHPVGLSDAEGSIDFYASASGNTGTGSFSGAHSQDRNQLVGKVAVERGDEYFAREGIVGVDVIKIDAEGWEPKVIAGLRNTIARDRPIIFMEYSSTTAASLREGIAELLRTLPEGYVALQATVGGREYVLTPVDRDQTETELVLIPSADRDRLLGSSLSTLTLAT